MWNQNLKNIYKKKIQQKIHRQRKTEALRHFNEEKQKLVYKFSGQELKQKTAELKEKLSKYYQIIGVIL